MTLYDIVAHDRASIDRNARRVVERGSYFLGERKHHRKDGSLVDVEVSASTLAYGGREVVCVVGRDVTERVEAFRMLEERLTALAGISASLTVDQTMEVTLDALAAGVVQSTAAVACSVVLMDEETYRLRTAGLHGLPEGYTAGLEEAYQAGMRPPPVEVFRTRGPLLVRDARQGALNTPFSSPLHVFLNEVPWDTIYFVPLVSRGRALGVLNLYYPSEHEPGEDEKVFLEAAADQTAVAVENARLFAAAQGKAALEEAPAPRPRAPRLRLPGPLRHSPGFPHRPHTARSRGFLRARGRVARVRALPGRGGPHRDARPDLRVAPGVAPDRGPRRRARTAGSRAQSPPRDPGAGYFRRGARGSASGGQVGTLPYRPRGLAQHRQACSGEQGGAEAQARSGRSHSPASVGRRGGLRSWR
jgi:hypothetical protein